MGLKAGMLTKRVTLERRAAGINDLGEPDGAWEYVSSKRASIEDKLGFERNADSGEYSRVTTRIRLRYDQDTETMLPNDRLVDLSKSPPRVYDIQGIQNPFQKDEELIFMCVRDGQT